MKKTAMLLFALILIMSMLTGCRRKPDGTPGDPTVNDSSATVPTTTVGTMPTTHATRPTTDPTRHTSGMENPTTTERGTTGTNTGPMESTDNSSGNRSRMVPGR